MPASIEQKPLLGKFHLTSTLIVKTGLHIGGGGETLDIGGLDKPVIRDPLTKQPYIPGSSIKGKLRSILERLLSKPMNRQGGSNTYRYESDDLEDGLTEIESNNSHLGIVIEYRSQDNSKAKQFVPIRFDGAKNCYLSRIFGSTGKDCWIETEKANEAPELIDRDWAEIEWTDGKKYTRFKGRNFPARLIVRDCHLVEDSIKRLKTVDTGLYMTEWKFENGIDRITSAANPRQIERVPADAKFHFDLIYTVEDTVQAAEDLTHLLIALRILQDDALGGHGSRGYGKVAFTDLNISYQAYPKREQPGQPLSDLPPVQSLLPEPAKTLQIFFDSFKQDINKLLPGSDIGNGSKE